MLLLQSSYSANVLHQLCNLCLSGGLPESIVKIIAGARLIALKKGERGVRPIAVGNCLRRLIAKLAIQSMKLEIAAYLAPHQYGVYVSGGAELMSHLVQMCLQQNPQHVAVKLDAKNAFNTVSCAVFLKELRQNFPQLVPFVSQCYRYSVPLTTMLDGKPYTIASKEDIQQGDPLAPFYSVLLFIQCWSK